jgi:fumarylacetoacetase
MKKRFLPPGFLHFPIGYTARTSSIVVSGTPVTRPRGQFRNGKGDVVYGPTEQMDYELEVACIIGKPSEFGKSVRIEDADDHIFGFVLLNDWSGNYTFRRYYSSLLTDIARDIQGLEMLPLGPLNGKSFATSISPWVISPIALEPFEISAPPREIDVAGYLKDPKAFNTYDIHLQADIIANESTTTICKSELKTMYWSFRDIITHQTSNGCNINTGDILATGTISGEADESHGCLLELTKGGQQNFKVNGGSRLFIEDGDSIQISAFVGSGVGFGECVGKMMPARS